MCCRSCSVLQESDIVLKPTLLLQGDNLDNCCADKQRHVYTHASEVTTPWGGRNAAVTSHVDAAITRRPAWCGTMHPTMHNQPLAVISQCNINPPLSFRNVLSTPGSERCPLGAFYNALSTPGIRASSTPGSQRCPLGAPMLSTTLLKSL